MGRTGSMYVYVSHLSVKINISELVKVGKDEKKVGRFEGLSESSKRNIK